MKLHEAYWELANSEKYERLCQGPSNKYNAYRNLLAKSKLGIGAMANTLIEFGYEIRANGMPVDEAISIVMSRPDYTKRWYRCYRSDFKKGEMGIQAKISTLKAFGYKITAKKANY